LAGFSDFVCCAAMQRGPGLSGELSDDVNPIVVAIAAA